MKKERDLHYKVKQFRLGESTMENLQNIKLKTGLSWNMLFTNLINLEKKYGMQKVSLGNRDKKSQTKQKSS